MEHSSEVAQKDDDLGHSEANDDHLKRLRQGRRFGEG